MILQLCCIPLARDTDHKPEVPINAGLDSGNSILDDDSPFRLNPEDSCGHQKRIRSRFTSKTLGLDRVAVDPHFEKRI